MIRESRRKFGLPYRIEWYAESPRLMRSVPTIYFQCEDTASHWGFRRQPFRTVWNSLSVGVDLLAQASSTVRNEIRQATDMHLHVGETSAADFLSFYKRFAKHNGLYPHIDVNLDALHNSITYMSVSDRVSGPLAMHALVIDRDLLRVRLLYSASGRGWTSVPASTVGKANKLLHWHEFQTFSNEHFAIYDWGGLAEKTSDGRLDGISKFKLAFGGDVVETSHYFPSFKLTRK